MLNSHFFSARKRGAACCAPLLVQAGAETGGLLSLALEEFFDYDSKRETLESLIYDGDEEELTRFHDNMDAFLIFLHETLGDAEDKVWAKKYARRSPAKIAKARAEAEREIRADAAVRAVQLAKTRAHNAKLARSKGKPGSLRRVWG